MPSRILFDIPQRRLHGVLTNGLRERKDLLSHNDWFQTGGSTSLPPGGLSDDHVAVVTIVPPAALPRSQIHYLPLHPLPEA